MSHDFNKRYANTLHSSKESFSESSLLTTGQQVLINHIFVIGNYCPSIDKYLLEINRPNQLNLDSTTDCLQNID